MPSNKQESNKKLGLFSKDLNINRHKEVFFENFVLIVSAGINVLEALDNLHQETKSEHMKMIIQSMIDDIEDGSSLWATFKKHKILSQNHLAIVQVGEDSGKLIKNLNIILDQKRKDKEIQSKLKSASLYPAIVFTLLIIIAGIAVVYFLPLLTRMYQELNVELPGITRYLISIGDFFETYGLFVVLLVLVCMILLVYFTFYYPKTRHVGQNLMFRVPGFGKLLKYAEFSRMGYFVSNLLDSGFSVNETFRILADSTELIMYRRLYEHALEHIEDGAPFSEIFKNYPNISRYMPIAVRQAIASGEKTGNLDTAFEQIHYSYQREHDYMSKNLGTMFEPFLLLIVFLGVAFLAIAVILPIYNLVGNLDTGMEYRPEPQEIEEAKLVGKEREEVEERKEESPEDTSELVDLNTQDKVMGAVEVLSRAGFESFAVYDGIEGDVVGQVEPETVLDYIKKEDYWYKVVSQEFGEVWIRSENVEKINEDF